MNRRANVAMSVIYAAGAGIWLYGRLASAVRLFSAVDLVPIAIFLVGLVAVSAPRLRSATAVHAVLGGFWLALSLLLLVSKRGFAFQAPTVWIALVLGALHLIQATSKRQVGPSPEGNEPTPAGTSPAS